MLDIYLMCTVGGEAGTSSADDADRRVRGCRTLRDGRLLNRVAHWFTAAPHQHQRNFDRRSDGLHQDALRMCCATVLRHRHHRVSAGQLPQRWNLSPAHPFHRAVSRLLIIIMLFLPSIV